MKLHLLKASALALLGAAAAVRAHEDPAQALHDVAKAAARAAVNVEVPPSGAPPRGPGQGPPRPSESCVRYSKVKCCLMECEDRDDKERCDDYCEKHYGETSEDASEPSGEIEDVAAGAATGNDDLDWCLEDCEYDSLDAFDENLCKAQCRRDFDNGNDRRRDWDRSPNNSPSRRRDGCDDDLDCCLDECIYNSRSTTDENLCQARCVRDFDGGNDSRRRPDYSPNRSPSSPSNRSPTYRRPSSPNRSPSSPNRSPSSPNRRPSPPNRSPRSPNRRPSPPNRSPSSPNRRPSPPNRSPSSPNRSPNARPAPSSDMDEAAVE